MFFLSLSLSFQWDMIIYQKYGVCIFFIYFAGVLKRAGVSPRSVNRSSTHWNWGVFWGVVGDEFDREMILIGN